MSGDRPEGLDWPDPVPAADPGEREREQAAPPEPAAAPGDEVPGQARESELSRLLGSELIVPIRSSMGAVPEPDQVTLEAMRHGTDDDGRFLAAFSSPEAFEQLGPHGSDVVSLPGRQLLERAERAGERVIIDPGWAGQLEIPAGVLPFLVAGIDLASPGALRARRPLGGLPPLEAPASVPEPFGSELRIALAELPAVERAWLLRVGTAWTVGVALDEGAPLSDFDVVRNRLHALAAEHLGSRRELIVTDLRAPALRVHYESAAEPYYTPPAPKGFLSRLFGRSD